MSTITFERPAWAGHRTRKAGSVYLGLAAVVNGVTGVWLVTNAGSDVAVSWLIELFVGSFGEFGALVNGATIGFLVGIAVPAAGIGLAVLGTVGFLAALDAYRGFRYRRSLASGLVGIVNPLALPLALLGAVHLALSRRTFASG